MFFPRPLWLNMIGKNAPLNDASLIFSGKFLGFGKRFLVEARFEIVHVLLKNGRQWPRYRSNMVPRPGASKGVQKIGLCRCQTTQWQLSKPPFIRRFHRPCPPRPPCPPPWTRGLSGLPSCWPQFGTTKCRCSRIHSVDWRYLFFG